MTLLRTTPWVAAMHGPRPADWERLSETCVRHSAVDPNEYRIHWLDVAEQNPFTLAVRHRAVSVAHPSDRDCGRPGCTLLADPTFTL